MSIVDDIIAAVTPAEGREDRDEARVKALPAAVLNAHSIADGQGAMAPGAKLTA